MQRSNVRVAGLLVLVVWLQSSSNYNLFSKIKAFGISRKVLFVSFNSVTVVSGAKTVP